MLVHIPFVLSLRARSQKTLFKSFLGHFLSLHCGYSINFRLICFCFSPFTLILLLLCVCVRVRVRARFQRSESQCAGEKCPASLWLILCFRSCVSLTFFFWFLFPCFFYSLLSRTLHVLVCPSLFAASCVLGMPPWRDVLFFLQLPASLLWVPCVSHCFYGVWVVSRILQPQTMR